MAARLGPELTAALAATGQEDREAHLCAAYRIVGRLHNASGLTDPVDPEPRRYFDRPFLVSGADRYAGALAGTVTDPALAALPRIGAADLWSDNTDLLERPPHLRAATAAMLDLTSD